MIAPIPTNVPVVHINTAELQRRVAVARASGPRGMEEGVKVMASAFVDFADRVSPKDTNRFVNGFIMAGAEIGATSKQPYPVRESRYRKMIENVLIRQERTFARQAKALETTLDRWYYSKGRSGPWLRKKERELRKLKKRHVRAGEELAAFRANPHAVGIDLFNRKYDVKVDGEGNVLSVKAYIARLASVRTKIYGGKGALITSGRRVFARLHNLEAHASFAERRHRVVARAMSQLRRVGVRRASRRYLEHQAIAGGLRLAGGSVSGSRGLPSGRLR